MNTPFDWSAVSSHLPYLSAHAQRLTRNPADAEDLLHDTVIRAVEGLGHLDDPPANLRSWLLVVMRRHWFNVVRGRQVRRGADAQLAEDGVDASLVRTRASFEQLQRAWRDLPESTQTIAAQCLIYEEPYDAVSDRLGVAKATVATSIYRMRRRLKKTLFGG